MAETQQFARVESLPPAFLQQFFAGVPGANIPGILPLLNQELVNRLTGMGVKGATPYTYQGERIAGFSPAEQQAFRLAGESAGSYMPYIQRGEQLAEQGLANVQGSTGLATDYLQQAGREGAGAVREAAGILRGLPGQFTTAQGIGLCILGQFEPRSTQGYYNPFEEQVVQQTIQDAIKANEMQNIGQRASDIAQGGESAFGSRARLSAGERQEAFGKGLGSMLANIRAGGFGQAQQLGMGEFQRQLDARRQAASGLSGLSGQRFGAETGLASTLAGYGQGEEAGRGRYASGLMGIGQQRGATAAGLGQQLAGYGGQLGQLGGYGQQLGQAQRQELMNLGSIPRNIQDTRYQRQFAQQTAQQNRPLQTLSGIAGLMPQYQAGSSQITGSYGLPVDPLAAGMQGAMSVYGGLYKNAYPGTT